MKKKLPLMNKISIFSFKIFIIIIMIIFLSIFIIIKYFNIKEYIFKGKKRVFKKKINYTREEAITRGKNFLNICLEEKLINNIKFKQSKKPIITVIVPIYNSELYIKKIIRSIQNQSMLNFEIILVNDVSTDNTLKIVEELQKEDPRIKLINNEKNKGILYSRCIGVLNAKGKYIVPLDHDDFFLMMMYLKLFMRKRRKQILI
jgi:cellulose synthase/poly-beta-1,6-N-acetylglucosamine synthase-like glycosyltransferase